MDEKTGVLTCPAGKSVWVKCKNFKINDGKLLGISYMGHIHDCANCELRTKCLRNQNTKARQVVLFGKGAKAAQSNYSEKMRQRFDTHRGRAIYSKRMGTVEPVFGHNRGTKRLDRFTLRGIHKVKGQWLLYCSVHNIGKVQVFGKSG